MVITYIISNINIAVQFVRYLLLYMKPDTIYKVISGITHLPIIDTYTLYSLYVFVCPSVNLAYLSVHRFRVSGCPSYVHTCDQTV